MEWLETNGTGAFAMGTVAGLNTRRYHALLVASLKPPTERYVLLSRFEEEAVVNGRTFALYCCQYPGKLVDAGSDLLEEFRDDPCATWRYTLGTSSMASSSNGRFISSRDARPWSFAIAATRL